MDSKKEMEAGDCCERTLASWRHLVVTNPGFRATLRSAARPAMEARVWPVLIQSDVDITAPEAAAWCLVAAQLALRNQNSDGTLSLGAALARACGDVKSKGSTLRLQRLLACDSLTEACTVLKPLLRFIESRVPVALSLASLLRDLLGFDKPLRRDAIKRRWARDFFKTEHKELSLVELDNE